MGEDEIVGMGHNIKADINEEGKLSYDLEVIAGSLRLITWMAGLAATLAL